MVRGAAGNMATVAGGLFDRFSNRGGGSGGSGSGSGSGSGNSDDN
jgi:hypothetical protein